MGLGPKVYVFKVGFVPENFVNYVSETLNSFYNSVKGLFLPELVEVYVYGSSREKILFLETEARDLGVIAVGDFVTVHEAWRGWPRIHVDYEKCRSLQLEYVKALILHEAAHSVLHGSPLYYMVNIDRKLIEDFGFEYAAKIIYLSSTVVKDLDVHKLLAEHGYRDYVEKYFEFLRNVQLRNMKCDDVLSFLELAKVLTPCIFLENECRNIEGNLHETCRAAVEEIIRILKELTTTYSHLGLNREILMIAKRIKDMVKERKR
ncbi:MAG: hypothetical protein DRO23_08290 [Thermoprotei archaeon]|nr:MAG: hypothetical protein DRO23_08290 [Thermoprotei archaeon]